MNYTDVEFEEEFVIVPSYEPHCGWVLIDEVDVNELEEEHAQRMRTKAVQKKFHTELIKMSSMTGKSVAELSGAWADAILQQAKASGRKVTEVSKQLHERIFAVIEKKAEPEIILNPNAYKDLEPCFPPARIV
jgi:predicted transcriptional regulator